MSMCRVGAKGRGEAEGEEEELVAVAMGKKKRKLMTDSVTVRKEETARGENRKQRSFISSTHFPSAIAFFGSVFSSAIPPHSHLSLPYKYLPSPCSLTCMHLPLCPFYLSPPHPYVPHPLNAHRRKQQHRKKHETNKN